ncbi:hypothetical protein ICV35_26780 [Rhodococcus ruber]|uniref:hypothetical protein n=1 Tax=Rhodococcus ruber TaxID=1830 RepID=UPI00177FDB0F|nr:hypothetical protein [Rhodococcus ruber]MBD8057246.1 hypothetical protein [Rhodococcus ruber]
MTHDLSLVDTVRASRLVLAGIDGAGEHFDQVLAECVSDPHGDGVERLISALVSQSAELASMVTGGDPSRFFLDVLAVATASGAEGATRPDGES